MIKILAVSLTLLATSVHAEPINKFGFCKNVKGVWDKVTCDYNAAGSLSSLADAEKYKFLENAATDEVEKQKFHLKVLQYQAAAEIYSAKARMITAK